ncbi:MAG: NADPH:quinone reductase-like Zn-dependent oxidoreductase [Paracoccaceae bacterium]|jgi:NADPH:quinone reductase-like Zn-dependent oxidoreductase
MKAAWYDRYGDADVLDIRDVAMPKIADDQILIKLQSSSVTTADWRLRASAFPGAFWLPGRLMFGLFAPRTHVLGGDFAGRVVAVGKDVTRFATGDSVFGFSTLGAHAEYLAVGEGSAVAAIPANLSFDQAAAVPFGGLSALVFLRDFAGLKPGQKVLINGASGGVGVFAVQVAKALGAEVTGISSAANLELVRSLGADHVIDHVVGDPDGETARYDVILDTIGTLDFAGVKQRLTAAGVFVPLNFGLRELWQSLMTSLRGGKRVVVGVSGDTQQDLLRLSDLLARGDIRPVIDGCYPLDRIAEAHRRVEGRHKTGAVVVTIEPADGAQLAAK